MAMDEDLPALKKRGRKKKNPLLEQATPDGGFEVELPPDIQVPTDDGIVVIDPETGAVEVTNNDGSVTIDPSGELPFEQDENAAETEFDDNLAYSVDQGERSRIAEDLLMAIDAAKSDRSQWLSMRAKLIELMGLKLDEPKSDVSTSALGMSTSVVRDPILQTIVEKFRANAYSELCPSGGPVKTTNFDDETAPADADATALQKDLNFFFTQIATEYYPDTYYMLWWTGLASGTFKKVYWCPRRRRPASEFVNGQDLIVPVNATDLKNAGLVAQEVRMRPSMLKRMQYLDVYRKYALTEPIPPTINAVDQKVANTEGKAAIAQRAEDQDYTLYECYCELNISGLEHVDDDGELTGLDRPYKVTIDETSREILEIRRNWKEDDEDEIAKIPFVLFPYSTGLSRIYGSGIGHMVGNIAMALTALTRISIDGGMAANYPGLLKAKGTGRQLVNEIRVPPGGCAEIDTGGLPIQQAVMSMPYRDISSQVIAFIAALRDVANAAGGAAELPVGEGTADIPVGTILAQIEQATKVEVAVHKSLHDAQKEEFQLFMELFQSEPESLWRGNDRPAFGVDKETRVAKFKKALDNWRVVPVSDPNTPSETHRLMKAQAMLQLGMNDPAINQVELKKRVARMMKIDDWDSLVIPPNPNAPQPTPEQMALMAKSQTDAKNAETKAMQVQLTAKNNQDKLQSQQEIEATKIAHQHITGTAQPPPNPLAPAELALKANKQQMDGVKIMSDAQNAVADREAKQNSDAMDIAAHLAQHPESQQVVNSELEGLAPFLKPAPGQDQSGSMAKGGKVPDDDVPDASSLAAILDEIDAFVKQGGMMQ